MRGAEPPSFQPPSAFSTSPRAGFHPATPRIYGTEVWFRPTDAGALRGQGPRSGGRLRPATAGLNLRGARPPAWTYPVEAWSFALQNS